MSDSEELNTSFTLSDASDPDFTTKKFFPLPDEDLEKQSFSSSHSEIRFRDYQKEIYENAKDRNGIIFLDTGTGKTFISLMLSCYYLYKTNRAKKIAFLANTVQLVRQQYMVISGMDDLHKHMKWDFVEYEGNESKIIIKELYSQLDQEEYNRKEWFQKFYRNTNILVVTPQIFLNNLRRGYFSLKEYSMIVFDECHHANEDHPYNNIMKEFYFEKKNSKNPEEREVPYIIGMTASPLVHLNKIDHDNIEASLIQICKNLDATFINYDRRKLDKFIQTPEWKVVSHEEIVRKEGEHLSLFEGNLNFNDIDNLFNKMPAPNQLIEKAFYEFNRKISEKGQAKSEKLSSIIQELQRFLSVLSLRILYELGYASYVKFFKDCLDLLLDRKQVDKADKNKTQYNFTEEIDRQIFETIKAVMRDIESKLEPEAEDLFRDNEKLSLKVRTFLRTLEQEYKEHEEENKDDKDLQILVFVERRYVVYHLQILLDNFYKNQARFNFKCGHILGFSKSDSIVKKYQDVVNNIKSLDTSIKEHQKLVEDYYAKSHYVPQILPSCFQQSNKFSHISVNLSHQLKTIEEFKKKTLNLLVSTSVAEEGFDMPECNLVISFNEIQTIQSFIQMRGRARKKGSKFIILIPEHKKKEMRERLFMFLKAVDVMKDIAEEISEYANINEYIEKARKFNPILIKPKAFKENFYKKIKIRHPDPQRESLLNTNWSKTVLSDYCNSLRKVIKAKYESRGQTKELDERNTNTGSLSINFRPIYVIHQIPITGFLCHIIMPLSSNTRVFITRGDATKTSSDAKQLAAFELVKYLFKNDNAFYYDLRPNIKSMKYEDDDNVEELIRNEEKRIESDDLRLKEKIRKIALFKKKVDNLRYYFFLTNEVFNPSFLLKGDNETPRYYFYLIEFYDQNNRQIGIKAKYQLGFLYFGETFRNEVAKGRILEDHSLRIRMVIRGLTKAYEIPEDIFTQMKQIDAFLWSVINNDDLNFFSIVAGENVDQNGFFNGFIKKKHEKTKFIPYNFDFSKEYLMLLVLNKKEPCLLAADKYREILAFIDEMKEHYLFYNSMKKKLDLKEKFDKKSINLDFVTSFKENPQKNEELIVQNITNFRKFQIKHYITIAETNLEKVTSIKSQSETLKTRKKNLEKNFSYKIKNDDYLIKVFGMSKCIENYLKTEIQHEEAKYNMKEKDLSSNLSFISEFMQFPLEFSFMIQLHFLNKPFMSYLRDFIKCVKFKKKLYKTLDRKNPYKQMLETNEDPNRKIQKDLGYTVQIPDNYILNHNKIIEKYLEKNEVIVILKPKLENLKKYQPKEQKNINLFDGFLDFPNLSQVFKMELMLLRSALMSRKYNLAENYERLEFFGDTILKALSTIQVFCDNQNEMERTLHIERNKYVSNNFLCSKSCINHFFKYVLNENFRFIPPYFLLKESKTILYNPKTQIEEKEEEEKKGEKVEKKEKDKRKIEFENFSQMSNKSLADLIESLTAVVYDSNNKDISFCQYFLYSFEILKQPVYNPTLINEAPIVLENKGLLKRYIIFQDIIGYQFKHPGLLIQAFTHLKFREVIEDLNYPKRIKKLIFEKNSKEGEIIEDDDQNFEKYEELNKISPAGFSYERLEFLGDAILDFFVNEYLFYETEVDSPGDLTLMKQSVVNNMSLSLIALHYDFDELILIGNDSFYHDEEGGSLEKIKENWSYYYENIDKYYELKNESLKILGDLFEAFVGALFVDTEFNFAKTKQIVRSMIYEKFLKVFASETYVNKLPEKKLKDILEKRGIKGARIDKQENKTLNGQKYLYILYNNENQEIYSVYANNMKSAENTLASIFIEKSNK